MLWWIGGAGSSDEKRTEPSQRMTDTLVSHCPCAGRHAAVRWLVSGTDPDRPRCGGSWPQSITHLRPDVTGWTTYNPHPLAVLSAERASALTTAMRQMRLRLHRRSSNLKYIDNSPSNSRHLSYQRRIRSPHRLKALTEHERDSIHPSLLGSSTQPRRHTLYPLMLRQPPKRLAVRGKGAAKPLRSKHMLPRSLRDYDCLTNQKRRGSIYKPICLARLWCDT